MLSLFVHKKSWRPLHLALSATSPIRETTLLRKQVGEGASSRLDAGDKMAGAAKRIKGRELSDPDFVHYMNDLLHNYIRGRKTASRRKLLLKHATERIKK